jgi:5'-3' exonuclease
MTHSRQDIRSIALVDLSYLFKRLFMIDPGRAERRTLDELAAIRKDVDRVVVCLDRPPYLRRDKFEAYKAQRTPPLPEEREIKNNVIASLKREGYQLAQARGYEADDLIATLAKAYGAWCEDVRMVASDKDIAQCITRNVVQFIPAVGNREAERRDHLKCKVKFGVYPAQMPLWQALCGDASDNIPGVPGIGDKKAAGIIAELPAATLPALAELLATGKKTGAMWKAIADHWEDLRLSLELVTLATDAPIDPELLLMPAEPDPDAEEDGVTMDGFERNATPMPTEPPEEELIDGAFDEAPELEQVKNQPLIGTDPRASEILQKAAEERAADKVPESAQRPAAAPERTVEQMAQDGHHRQAEKASAAVANDVAQRAPEPPAPAPAPAKAGPGLAKAPVQPKTTTALAKAEEWGLVTARLQPTDLMSAWTLSKWLATSGLYGKKFENAAQIFAVLHRGVELGLDVGTALSTFHMIDGKPSMGADLIRALAKRHEDCEYFYCESSDERQATWVTRNRKHPPGVVQRLTYTIEEAKQVPMLWKKDKWGGPSMWEKYPKPMLSKTASTMLARQEWESSMLGMYCPEELGGYIDTEGVAA